MKNIIIKTKNKVIPYLKDFRLFLAFIIAWMITNGWSYIMLGLGFIFKIKWMQILATSYLAILWLPCTPEKLITIPLSIWIYKRLKRRKEKKTNDEK